MADARGHGRPAYTPEEVARFEALVTRYAGHVYAISYRLAGNEADAKDLAQEAFVRLWRSLRRIEPGAALEGWLYRVVTNLYIDLVRRRPKQRPQSLDEPIPTEAGERARERPDLEADVERTVLDRTIDRRIQDALMALHEDLRMVVVLSDIEGYAYEEIATIVDVPIGTVKSRLHRARRALRERLGPIHDDLTRR
ncbi:MAG: sigma-70 family RNA polymerase sigma factor [Armatimonadetes bacterium]|nr:sigma-70 family RNA polymerase sigma factor [Armatimonadota bacterium]